MSKLSERMKNMRLMRGVSIKSIAEYLQCTPNTIVNWENGKISPQADAVEKLCQMYYITPNQLFGWDQYDELEKFIKENKEIIDKMGELQKQKSEIEKRLQKYADQLNQRL